MKDFLVLKKMSKVSGNYFSSEFMSNGLEWTIFERNYFTASLKFDNKYKTFEAKIIQEP